MADSPAAAAQAAAARIDRWIGVALEERGRCSLAVSGGSTPPAMFRALAERRAVWDGVTITQVDERVAPDGDAARNAGQLDEFPTAAARMLMPVTASDPEAAVAEFSAHLPRPIDIVHLGLGDDGHTASWPPGRVPPSRRPVEIVPDFNGHDRWTMTPNVVNAASHRLVLVVGSDKAPALASWLVEGVTLPITSVVASGTTIVVDRAAAARLGE